MRFFLRKNVVLIILFLSLCFGVLRTDFVKAQAREQAENEWTDKSTGITWVYEVNKDNGKEVTLYFRRYNKKNTLRKLVVPGRVKSYVVTALGDGGCDVRIVELRNFFAIKRNDLDNVQVVILPESINHLGERGLANLKGLKEVRTGTKLHSRIGLSTKIRVIGKGCFIGDPNIYDVFQNRKYGEICYTGTKREWDLFIKKRTPKKALEADVAYVMPIISKQPYNKDEDKVYIKKKNIPQIGIEVERGSNFNGTYVGRCTYQWYCLDENSKDATKLEKETESNLSTFVKGNRTYYCEVTNTYEGVRSICISDKVCVRYVGQRGMLLFIFGVIILVITFQIGFARYPKWKNERKRDPIENKEQKNNLFKILDTVNGCIIIGAIVVLYVTMSTDELRLEKILCLFGLLFLVFLFFHIPLKKDPKIKTEEKKIYNLISDTLIIVTNFIISFLIIISLLFYFYFGYVKRGVHIPLSFYFVLIVPSGINALTGVLLKRSYRRNSENILDLTIKEHNSLVWSWIVYLIIGVSLDVLAFIILSVYCKLTYPVLLLFVLVINVFYSLVIYAITILSNELNRLSFNEQTRYFIIFLGSYTGLFLLLGSEMIDAIYEVQFIAVFISWFTLIKGMIQFVVQKKEQKSLFNNNQNKKGAIGKVICVNIIFTILLLSELVILCDISDNGRSFDFGNMNKDTINYLYKVIYYVITLTTVGFGEFGPHTAKAYFVTIIIIITGFVLFTLFINYVINLGETTKKKKTKIKIRTKTCNTLYTVRLKLEPLGLKHLNSTYEYTSNIENTKYMVHLPSQSIKETKTFLQKVESEWQKEEPTYWEYAILMNEEHCCGQAFL